MCVSAWRVEDTAPVSYVGARAQKFYVELVFSGQQVAVGDPIFRFHCVLPRGAENAARMSHVGIIPFKKPAVSLRAPCASVRVCHSPNAYILCFNKAEACEPHVGVPTLQPTFGLLWA